MKLTNIILLSLVIFLALSLVNVESRATSKRSQSSTQYWIRPLIKTAKSYLSFANLAYCKPEIINALACPLCSSILDQSYKVLDHHTALYKNFPYRFVVLVSEAHKEVVISFAGPKSKDGLMYTAIYTSGFGKIHGEGVEKAYLNIYINLLAQPLHNSVRDMLNKTPLLAGYKFLFVGHSFGGSLAVLAAFDLIKSNILRSQIGSPLVYSYGQLRIGDDRFVETVNSLFKVVRIVKNSDFMTRLPNCVWSQQTNQWRCFRDTQKLMMRFPEYRQYIMNYGPVNGQTQHYTGIQAAYGNNRSFLERSSRAHKGYFYSANNPGYKTFSYGSNLVNQGSKTQGNVYYSQPMGAEVLFSETFKKFQVCNFFKGIPNCEKQLPKKFNPASHANYYGQNVEDC